MTQQDAQNILDKIIGQVFGYQNPLSLAQFMQKFAFDIALPQQVYDTTDGTPTWAQTTTPTKYIKVENALKRDDLFHKDGQKIDFKSIEEILSAWSDINYYTTERYTDCSDILESDTIQQSQFVYRSQDIRRAKNVIFSDGVSDSEFIAASQRSSRNNFCVRVEDSVDCSNSFHVTWSAKINNSIFIHDCYDMKDSMFCTNMAGAQYCIANMQYTKEEYEEIRKMVIGWLLSPPQ